MTLRIIGAPFFCLWCSMALWAGLAYLARASAGGFTSNRTLLLHRGQTVSRLNSRPCTLPSSFLQLGHRTSLRLASLIVSRFLPPVRCQFRGSRLRQFQPTGRGHGQSLPNSVRAINCKNLLIPQLHHLPGKYMRPLQALSSAFALLQTRGHRYSPYLVVQRTAVHYTRCYTLQSAVSTITILSVESITHGILLDSPAEFLSRGTHRPPLQACVS